MIRSIHFSIYILVLSVFLTFQIREARTEELVLCANNGGNVAFRGGEPGSCKKNETEILIDVGPGPQGEQGADGLSCWDLNADGIGDHPEEDINSDGNFDTLDCIGPPGQNGQDADPAVLADLQSQIDSLQAQIGALVSGTGKDLSACARIEEGEINGLAGPHLIVEGCNLHVRNGNSSDSTDNCAPSGQGNLVVGYNEILVTEDRTGCHNVVIGQGHAYSSYGGLVTGFGNSLMGTYSSAIGGSSNFAIGTESVVTGGTDNIASSDYSVVVGGTLNEATGLYAVVNGGANNEASGQYASVFGGGGLGGAYESFDPGANFERDISPGSPGLPLTNPEYEFKLAVFRPFSMFDPESYTMPSDDPTYAPYVRPAFTLIDLFLAVLIANGGKGNLAEGMLTTVVGGTTNLASSDFSLVSGGGGNAADGVVSSVSGGINNTANGGVSSVSGGFSNVASGIYSSVSGGGLNVADIILCWRAGTLNEGCTP